MLLTKLKITTVVLFVASTAAFTCGVLAMRQQPSPLDNVQAQSQAKSTELPKEGKNKQQGKHRQVPKEIKDDAKRVDGNWKVVAIEEEGKKTPCESVQGMSWTIKNSELEMTAPERGAKASVKTDWSKTPKHIDLVALEPSLKGQTIQGVFTLEKDRLVVCLRDLEAAGEKGRPKEFRSEAGSGLGIFTLERVPPPRERTTKE